MQVADCNSILFALAFWTYLGTVHDKIPVNHTFNFNYFYNSLKAKLKFLPFKASFKSKCTLNHLD